MICMKKIKYFFKWLNVRIYPAENNDKVNFFDLPQNLLSSLPPKELSVGAFGTRAISMPHRHQSITIRRIILLRAIMLRPLSTPDIRTNIYIDFLCYSRQCVAPVLPFKRRHRSSDKHLGAILLNVSIFAPHFYVVCHKHSQLSVISALCRFSDRIRVSIGLAHNHSASE